jgi:6-phosphogluconolactonase (cycloisomerase 2 family)
MTLKPPFLIRLLRIHLGAWLLIGCAAQAYAIDTYNPGNKQLSMPLLTIGSASLAGVVVSVGGILSGPSGASANGTADSYDPASQQLTVQSVSVGSATFHNVVVSVASLVSIVSVSGADAYDGAELAISNVRVGGTVYTAVAVTVGSIVSAGGGMPASAWDVYDPAGSRLTIAAVQVGGKVYTNAIITVAKVISGGSTGFAGYAYAPSSAASLVGQFEADVKGPLSALIPPTVPINNSNPVSIAADSSSRFVYVADANAGAIYQFHIGAAGALLPLSPGSTATAVTASYIVASPIGPYLYAATASSGIYEFNIASNGLLSPMSTPSVRGPSAINAISMDPQGKFLFVSGLDSISAVPVVSVYPIGAGGAAGGPTEYAGVTQGTAVAVDPTDSYTYQVTGAMVQEYVNSGGFFSPGASTSTTGNNAPWAAFVDPSGKYVYVTGAVLSQFTIGTEGALQAMAPATVNTGSNSTAMAFAPSGKFAYVLNASGSISQFSIGPTGALTLLSPASVPGDGAGQALIVVPLQLN